MKKVVVGTFFYIIISLHADQTCDLLYDEYNISKDLKSIKGWSRVCVNNKLQNYTDITLNKHIINRICMCLSTEQENLFGNKYIVKNNK